MGWTEKTKEILSVIGNDTTKVQIKEDFSGNYYSYINDTIYLSGKEARGEPQANINQYASKYIMVCHECIHSVQSRLLHITNTILSNLSIIFFLVCIIQKLALELSRIVKITTVTVCILAIVIRVVLEIWAIIGSLKLSETILSKRHEDNFSNEDVNIAKVFIKKHIWLALIQMVWDKLAIILVVALI